MLNGSAIMAQPKLGNKTKTLDSIDSLNVQNIFSNI